MLNSSETLAHATQFTAADLKKTILASPKLQQLSHLTLPEIEALTDQIAQVVPAGNIPGLILSGLTRIEGRNIPRGEQKRHLGMLFRGVRDLLDKAVYGAMFAGPAAVILGYQNLLRLAGKDVAETFPDGTWQFYLEFALREDTARHANETIGFHRTLAFNKIALSEPDKLSAWIMASLLTLQNYHRFLQNEWRERVYIALLKSIAGNESPVQNAYQTWESQRPFARGQDAANDDYSTYRQRKFDEFIQPLVASLPISLQRQFWQEIASAEQSLLSNYIKQMQILAYLGPEAHSETRVAYPFAEANVAVVFRGNYYILPAWDERSQRVLDIHTLRRLVNALLAENIPMSGDVDLLLARAYRAAQPSLRHKTGTEEQRSLLRLQHTPIILNWDKRDAQLPLAYVRNGQRGIGDHALTLFFTEESTVFDQSHIFFDGAWGATLAEVMTSEAISWARYISQLPPAAPASTIPQRLTFRRNDAVTMLADHEQLPAEANAESTHIRLGSTLVLRRLFKSRSDLITVTVNDLFILYRSIFGQRYVPSPLLVRQVEQLRNVSPNGQSLYTAIIEAFQKIQHSNPAILIPMDASTFSPRERLFPTTFRNSMTDFLQWHDATLAALQAYQQAQGDRRQQYATFDEKQRTYLSMIAAFGMLMKKYKDIALSGQSTSTATIRLLGYLPNSVKVLLDQIPEHFDVLNEILKGEEVFSNVGRVVKGSSLRRFMTAKDDNQKKTLAWGVITDDQNIVHLNLRDFRPHVTMLHQNGMRSLADAITQDFIDAYANGYNLFIQELREITLASRETRSKS